MNEFDIIYNNSVDFLEVKRWLESNQMQFIRRDFDDENSDRIRVKATYDLIATTEAAATNNDVPDWLWSVETDDGRAWEA